MTLKEKLINIGKGILYFIIFWVALTTIIQRFKCPELSETELFIRIPNSYIWDWYDCNE